MVAGFAAQDAAARACSASTARRRCSRLGSDRAHRASTAEAIELGRAVDEEEIVLLDEWHAGTYGIPDEKTLDAIRLCARLEGMLTDPVYEGKSMAALIDLVRDGRIDRARACCTRTRRAACAECLRERVRLATARLGCG